MEVEDIYVWSTGDTTTTAELTIANANLNTSSIIWMERLVEEREELLKKENILIVLNQSLINFHCLSKYHYHLLI